jgi:hypothetical protein
MKRIIFSSLFMLFFSLSSYAQSKTNDISISQLPPEVKAVLDEYIKILNTSQSLDECATRFTAIAGGGLVNEDGLSLRSSIQPYSLKKDYENLKFYKVPVLITRVNMSPSNGSGYGPSAIKGQVYKIWISKKDGGAGLPAPISIMVPEGHPTINTPKVVGIGSL